MAQFDTQVNIEIKTKIYLRNHLKTGFKINRLQTVFFTVILNTLFAFLKEFILSFCKKRFFM